MADNETTTDSMPDSTIEVVGGSTPVSFDELEGVHEVHEAEKKAEAKTAEKKAKTETKAAKKDSIAESDSGEEAGQKEESKEDERSLNEKANAKPAEEKDKAAKTIKAKVGEDELELRLDAMIPTKVKGQELEVSLEELRNNYAGKVAWSEEFSKLGTEKQKFRQERQEVNSALGEIFEISKTDGVAALMKMAEYSGLDPIKWRQDFLNLVLPQLENYMQMDETERKAAEAEFEKDYYRNQLESQSKRQEQEQSFKAFEARVQQLQQTHQIDPETFSNTFFALQSLQKEGQLKKEITAEFVVEVIKAEKVYDALTETFAELKLDLPEQEQSKILRDLAEIADRNPELSMDDLKEIVRDVWGKTKAKNLSRKIQKATPGAATRQTAPRNPAMEPITFDDL